MANRKVHRSGITEDLLGKPDVAVVNESLPRFLDFARNDVDLGEL